MLGVAIDSTESLNDRCKQIVKAVDSFLKGYKLATNKKLSELGINIKDHHDLTKCLGLEPYTEISRNGVVLYGIK
ncbi:hypothetical protein AVI51_15680 (plasmid) [Piscirickettsia salmonis]|uniref:Uncharacterized protein n=1 Tax=Piscirickettsia salmonis TaxID=1238 RepID=A0A9Q6LIZ7_PISSA|nr:hypothetical protein [Piscirickettsia salmonis]APS46096.1 hypothetical protein AVI48_16970 [Piscirickettsia salmonis]APS49142.1 hypothetical protein AVI49_15890 [Piscirickettsia salmonis]APS52400.1 hypothetical protein AVI50_16245 [Piscirickettsia salmonis]APS55551.1 hypothetical protein AVI51_15680 [Piscirickettsia salmonis]APS58930.1 hypothetical protein AVI52_16985 [Piscirickettsia salmonis]